MNYKRIVKASHHQFHALRRIRCQPFCRHRQNGLRLQIRCFYRRALRVRLHPRSDATARIPEATAAHGPASTLRRAHWYVWCFRRSVRCILQVHSYQAPSNTVPSGLRPPRSQLYLCKELSASHDTTLIVSRNRKRTLLFLLYSQIVEKSLNYNFNGKIENYNSTDTTKSEDLATPSLVAMTSFASSRLSTQSPALLKFTRRNL